MKKAGIGCGAILLLSMGFGIAASVGDMLGRGQDIGMYGPYLTIALAPAVIAGLRLYWAARATTFRGQRLIKVGTGIVTWLALIAMAVLILAERADLIAWSAAGLVLTAVVALRTVAQERYCRDMAGQRVRAGTMSFDASGFLDLQWPAIPRWLNDALALWWVWWVVRRKDEIIAALHDDSGTGVGLWAVLTLMPFVVCFLWAHPSSAVFALPGQFLLLFWGVGTGQVLVGFWAVINLGVWVRLALMMPTDRRTNQRRAWVSFLHADAAW